MPAYIMETTYTPDGTKTDAVIAETAILICQDAKARHVVMYGRRKDLEDLLAWGAVNRSICSPTAEEVSATERTLRPRIGASKDVLWIRPGSGNFTVTDDKPSDWTVDYTVNVSGEQCRFSRMSDALLFIQEKDGTRKKAVIGSGFQRQSLLETGIGALFGEEALAEYTLVLHGPPTGLSRRAYEQALKMTRDRPRTGGRSPSVLVIDILQLTDDEEDPDDDSDK